MPNIITQGIPFPLPQRRIAKILQLLLFCTLIISIYQSAYQPTRTRTSLQEPGPSTKAAGSAGQLSHEAVDDHGDDYDDDDDDNDGDDDDVAEPSSMPSHGPGSIKSPSDSKPNRALVIEIDQDGAGELAIKADTPRSSRSSHEQARQLESNSTTKISTIESNHTIETNITIRNSDTAKSNGTINAVHTAKINTTVEDNRPPEHSHTPEHSPYEPRYDHIAVALKTGRDVAVKRTAIQVLTFLLNVRNFVIIGESSGVRVGRHVMIDVYSGLYPATPSASPHPSPSASTLPSRIPPPPSAAASVSNNSTVSISSTATASASTSSTSTLPVPAANASSPAPPDSEHAISPHPPAIDDHGAAPVANAPNDGLPSSPFGASEGDGEVALRRRRLHKRGDSAQKNSQKSVADEGSQGWKLDAHKNLPGFRHMWETFSAKGVEWFLMIDDDTFVLMDNLVENLKRYNSSEHHYFGFHSLFTGCDGVSKFGEGPPFAHGGSGIVLSRGALATMMTGIDRCIARYKPCWAGDVRTALCLRDHNITLTPLSHFHRDPPNDEFSWHSDPCALPSTFHHLLPDQIQELFSIEMDVKQSKANQTGHDHASAGRNLNGHGASALTLNYGELYQRIYDKPQVLEGVDLPGNDIQKVKVPSWEDCQQACESLKICVSWTYDESSYCWLKDSPRGRTSRANFVSGLIPTRYNCNALSKKAPRNVK